MTAATEEWRERVCGRGSVTQFLKVRFLMALVQHIGFVFDSGARLVTVHQLNAPLPVDLSISTVGGAVGSLTVGNWCSFDLETNYFKCFNCYCYFEAICSLGDCSSSIVQLSALYQAVSLQQLLNSASHRLLLPPFSSLTTSFEVTTGSVG